MPLRSRVLRLLLPFTLSAACFAQTPPPISGDITVRLTEGIDSANGRPLQISHATVIDSTSPDVPRGTPAIVQLSPVAAGGFTVHLAALTLGGRIVRAGSTNPALTTASKIFGRLQQPVNAPAHPAVSGAHVFLPANTEVRFTLAAPPAMPSPPQPVARVPPPPPAQPEPAPASAGPPPPLSVAGITLQPSRPPDPGCRWIPYVSRKYHLAFPVEQCTGSMSSANAVYTDASDGIAFRSAETSQKDLTLIQVFTKTAAEPITSAIQRVARPKLKPAARLACHATLDKQASPSGPVELYRFSATVGALAKKEKNADFTDEEPCGEFEDYDSAPFFIYMPAQSKTVFFFANFGQESPPWDFTAAVLLPASGAAPSQETPSR